MSAVQHLVAVKKPYDRCMGTEDDVLSGQMVCRRSLK